MLRVQLHRTAEPASKLSAAKEGHFRSSTFPEPCLVLAHILGLILAQPLIPQEPLHGKHGIVPPFSGVAEH